LKDETIDENEKLIERMKIKEQQSMNTLKEKIISEQSDGLSIVESEDLFASDNNN